MTRRSQERAGHTEGWNLGHRDHVGVKELTLELGTADIYINTARKVDLDNGHTLYEAVLTDDTGSRAIYIDKDDVIEALQDMFIGQAESKTEDPG